MTRDISNQVKTCKSCGIQKPLSAFLQYSGRVGSSYSNICTSCRANTTPKASQDTDSGTMKTEKKIDAKAKVWIEINDKNLRKELDERDEIEKDKKTTVKSKHAKLIDVLKTADRTRRNKQQKTATPSKPAPEIPSTRIEIERQEREVNVTSTSDTFIPKLKYQSSAFRAFLLTLPKGSAMRRAMEKSTDSTPKEFIKTQFKPKR